MERSYTDHSCQPSFLFWAPRCARSSQPLPPLHRLLWWSVMDHAAWRCRLLRGRVQPRRDLLDVGWICVFDGRTVGPALQAIAAPTCLGDSGLFGVHRNSADRTGKYRKPFDECRCSPASNKLVRPSSYHRPCHLHGSTSALRVVGVVRSIRRCLFHLLPSAVASELARHRHSVWGGRDKPPRSSQRVS